MMKRRSTQARGSASLVAPVLFTAFLMLLTLVAAGPSSLLAGSLANTRGDGSTADETLPPAKQAEIDARDAELAAAAAANARNGISKVSDPGPPKAGVGDRGTILEPNRAAGTGTIVESTEPAPGSSLSVLNQWFEDTGGGAYVTVYAGGDPTDPSAGVIQITYGVPGDLERYDALGRHGPLQIIAADEARLTLRATDGTTTNFDVSTRAFK